MLLKLWLQAAQKDPEAQRSIWVFFSNLLIVRCLSRLNIQGKTKSSAALAAIRLLSA
jgi:hypothetical protein